MKKERNEFKKLVKNGAITTALFTAGTWGATSTILAINDLALNTSILCGSIPAICIGALSAYTFLDISKDDCYNKGKEEMKNNITAKFNKLKTKLSRKEEMSL